MSDALDEMAAWALSEGRELVAYTLAVRFDYDAGGEPLWARWPVSAETWERLDDALALHEEGQDPFVWFAPFRLRRDVWLNLARVREVNLCFDGLSALGLPTTLEKDEAAETQERELGLPLDLYPLAVVAFRGVEHSYDAEPRWLALSDLSPEDVRGLAEEVEMGRGLTLLRFTDDDGEVRLVRRRDVAFVDLAAVDVERDGEGDEVGEPFFVAEREGG